MARGHRTLPHTADLVLEAWGRSRDECLTEAVLALVDSFTGARPAVPAEWVTTVVEASSDAELLVQLLDEVIYQLDAYGRVPVAVSVHVASAGGTVRADLSFGAVPATAVEVAGAIPKGVSRHELRFTRIGGRWRCRVTVDV